MAPKNIAAGQAEIDEAGALAFKLPFLQRLLNDGMNPLDGFDMHLLSITLPTARAYSVAMERFNGNLLGVEFKSKARDAYACVLPELSEGGFRILYFTQDGFSGHHCEPTQTKAEVCMITEGYVIPTPGVMDVLSTTPEWERGLAYAELISMLNRKQIDFEELARRRDALNAQYTEQKQTLACA